VRRGHELVVLELVDVVVVIQVRVVEVGLEILQCRVLRLVELVDLVSANDAWARTPTATAAARISKRGLFMVAPRVGWLPGGDRPAWGAGAPAKYRPRCRRVSGIGAGDDQVGAFSFALARSTMSCSDALRP
jgi:hypothetical protein